MEGVDAKFLQSIADVDRGEHSSVRRALFAVSSNLHAASDPDERLPPTQISDMDESIIEASEDVADPEDELSSDVFDKQASLGFLCLLGFLALGFLACLCRTSPFTTTIRLNGLELQQESCRLLYGLLDGTQERHSVFAV